MSTTLLFHESAPDFGVVVCENDTLCTCILSAPAWLCQAMPWRPLARHFFDLPSPFCAASHDRMTALAAVTAMTSMTAMTAMATYSWKYGRATRPRVPPTP